jgi:hypothetical protein
VEQKIAKMRPKQGQRLACPVLSAIEEAVSRKAHRANSDVRWATQALTLPPRSNQSFAECGSRDARGLGKKFS